MIRTTHDYLKYSIWCKSEYDEILENQINNSEILIVGLSWCPWTQRAKNLIKKEYNQDPTILAPDIISNLYKINLLYCMCKRVNTVYVPQIWLKGKHIGGFEQLYKMHHRNKINPILEDKNNINKLLL
jgi:glutaredoxin